MKLLPPGRPILDYLPVSFFGSVMGLTGLSLAWKAATEHFGVPGWIGAVIGIVALVAFVALSIGYGVKMVTAWDAVRTEFKHPVASNLFGTVPISLLLSPLVVVQMSPLLAQIVWAIGAIMMVGFAWLIVSRWMHDRQQIAYATPAWVIPVVGLLDLPLALPALGLPLMQSVAIFALAVGLFFSVPLFTLIFSRLVFAEPMPTSLTPSLLILVAPFAVGYSSYTAVTGGQDFFSEALYMLMLFMLTVLLGLIRHLAACCPFRVSWWSLSFPLSASAITSMHFAMEHPSWLSNTIAGLILALATLIIAALLLRTFRGLWQGELRTLSS